MMSGDKLLGGPQAGIIVGDHVFVSRLRASPLARALRVDKLTIAALEATLALYREPARALREVPTLAMLTAPVAQVHARATALVSALGAHGIRASSRASEATVGGGAFPTARIPSAAIALDGDAQQLAERLRGAELPVIGRIEHDVLLLDLRSVPASHDSRLAASLASVLT